jgi:hypothetical protein
MLETFYKNGRHLLAMHDEAVTAEREVARRAREAIDAGITEERVLDADGKNKVIGGIPDVVLVNAAGASPLI